MCNQTDGAHWPCDKGNTEDVCDDVAFRRAVLAASAQCETCRHRPRPESSTSCPSPADRALPALEQQSDLLVATDEGSQLASTGFKPSLKRSFALDTRQSGTGAAMPFNGLLAKFVQIERRADQAGASGQQSQPDPRWQRFVSAPPNWASRR